MTDIDQLLTERVDMRYVWTCIALGTGLFLLSVYMKVQIGDMYQLRGFFTTTSSLLLLFFLYIIINLLQILKDNDTVGVTG